jgi:hypothetical protein
MELAAASEMSQGIGSISNRHGTPSGAHVTGWQWIALRRFRSRGLRREAVGAASRDGGLVGGPCLETPNPRVGDRPTGVADDVIAR